VVRIQLSEIVGFAFQCIRCHTVLSLGRDQLDPFRGQCVACGEIWRDDAAPEADSANANVRRLQMALTALGADRVPFRISIEVPAVK
jgi:hypothetical protein